MVNFPIQKVGAKPNVLPNWTVKKITKPGRYPVAENLGGTNRLMRFFASSCESLASRMLLDCTFGSAARRLSCDTTKQHTCK